jgi:hypothetical protein
MPASIAAAIPVLSAGALGGATAAVYAVLTGIAFHDMSRAWEMGAIPLLLASFVFVGLLSGIVAGLGCRRHPYLAALVASFLILVIASAISDFREELTPALTRDERREFWANIEGLLFAGFPFGLPLALWGALVTDLKPGRLAVVRDFSYGPIGFVVFVAIVPAALRWLPWQGGMVAAAAAALAFALWIARRNRRR